MIILAIETSCDETSVALIEASPSTSLRASGFKILSNIVSSQVELHKKYGGVYPSLAKREHQRNLLLVLTKALKESKLLNPKSLPTGDLPKGDKIQILKSILEREQELLKRIIPFFEKYEKPKIDAIAVTNGPGLEPCLWVGVNFARAFSYFWNIPIVPVNHVEGHIAANFIDGNPKVQITNYKLQKNSNFQLLNSKYLFPAVCLIVSGGHTQLVLMEKPASAKASAGKVGKYKILGETRDDAAGECFDKTARILGLGYPGGPAVAKAATEFEIRSSKFEITLPRPMLNSKDYDFSFSGLKTAVLYQYQKSKDKSRNYVNEMASEVQQAIIDVLINKTIKTAKDFKAKSIILGGGVSANEELRKQFKLKIEKEQVPRARVCKLKIDFLVPPKNLCTDNAAMIGVAGYFNWLKKRTKNWKSLKAEANLRIGEQA